MVTDDMMTVCLLPTIFVCMCVIVIISYSIKMIADYMYHDVIECSAHPFNAGINVATPPMLKGHLDHMSRDARKPVFGVSDLRSDTN